MEKGIMDYEIINHGIEHSQYFQGQGTAHTDYTDAFTGIGDTAREALNDAIEGAAIAGYSVESLEADLPHFDNNESVSETLLKEIEQEWVSKVESECRDYKFGIHPGESYTCPDCIQSAGYNDSTWIEEQVDAGLEKAETENPDLTETDLDALAEQLEQKYKQEFPAYLKEEWENGNFLVEESFSWSSCDLCGSSLGGDRHPAHGASDNDIIHYDICTDCVLYLANGDLPDFSEFSEFQDSETYHYVSILVR